MATLSYTPAPKPLPSHQLHTSHLNYTLLLPFLAHFRVTMWQPMAFDAQHQPPLHPVFKKFTTIL